MTVSLYHCITVSYTVSLYQGGGPQAQLRPAPPPQRAGALGIASPPQRCFGKSVSGGGVLVASTARSQTPLSSEPAAQISLERRRLCQAWHAGLRRLSRSAECSRTTQHARCAPARRATATVARVKPCDSVARGLVLLHPSALAAREAKTWQRSSRGHLLHYFFTTPAPPVQSGRAQAATRRVVARPSPLRSRLRRRAALSPGATNVRQHLDV
jgi:hypothetical protein